MLLGKSEQAAESYIRHCDVAATLADALRRRQIGVAAVSQLAETVRRYTSKAKARC
ncbi:hypothetical protein ABIE49_006148 [Bradyrhizobium sp. OAE829]